MFAVRSARKSVKLESSSNTSTKSITSTINLYNEPPYSELSIDEFESYAIARLKVLRKLEELKTRNTPADKLRQALDAVLHQNIEDAKMDVASHFILRGAYCRTEELRRWFITMETTLFRHRLENASAVNPRIMAQLLLSSGQNCSDLKAISEDEKSSLKHQLQTSGKMMTPAEFAKSVYYKVPFTQALDLIRSREVFVKHGYAFVPTTKLVSIITSKFRMSLSGSLARASQAFSQIQAEFPRIAPLLANMNQQYTGKDYSNAKVDGEQLNAKNVDEMSKQSMPLCMRQMQAGLKSDRKLKHWARMQYGLFLKGAGLSMEESLLFFQQEFTKIMSTEDFNKKYAYNIRHMYGKEGKRQDYTPYNCQKIILGNQPQSGEHHGCPYKTYDDFNLSSLLSKMNINGKDKEAIMQHKRMKNYNLACQKHFEATHPNAVSVPDVELDGVGMHPNAWFRASTSYHTVVNKSGGSNNTKIKTENNNNIVSPESSKQIIPNNVVSASDGEDLVKMQM